MLTMETFSDIILMLSAPTNAPSEDGQGRAHEDGFAAGVYGGYNFEFANRFVIGGEFEWGKSSSSRDELILGDGALQSRFGAFGAARFRAGYAFDRLLAFGAVGVGIASIGNGYRYTVQKGCDTLEQAIWDENVKAGLVAGGGSSMPSPSILSRAVNISTPISAASRCRARTEPRPNSATRCISCAWAPVTGSDIPLAMVRRRSAAGPAYEAAPNLDKQTRI